MVQGKKKNYFKVSSFIGRNHLATIERFVWQPEQYIPVIMDVAKNCESAKGNYKRAMCQAVEQMQMLKKKDSQGIQQSVRGGFNHFYQKITAPEKSQSFVVKRLEALRVRRSKEQVLLFVQNIHRSKVLGAFLRLFIALMLDELAGCTKVEENDVIDHRHYIMSGFCSYFITDDSDLLRILGRIPEEYRHVEVMSLPEFIEGHLMPEVK